MVTAYTMFLLAERVAKTRLQATFKLIQTHTCIKFRQTKMAPLITSRADKFVVVFSNHGNRYKWYMRFVTYSFLLETFQCSRYMVIIVSYSCNGERGRQEDCKPAFFPEQYKASVNMVFLSFFKAFVL